MRYSYIAVPPPSSWIRKNAEAVFEPLRAACGTKLGVMIAPLISISLLNLVSQSRMLRQGSALRLKFASIQACQ